MGIFEGKKKKKIQMIKIISRMKEINTKWFFVNVPYEFLTEPKIQNQLFHSQSFFFINSLSLLSSTFEFFMLLFT